MPGVAAISVEPIVDSHCHLDFDVFSDDLDEVVRRARSAGVCRMLTIGTRQSSFCKVLEIAERFEDVYCSVGVHPHQAEQEGLTEPDWLVEQAQHPKVVGIGESGLDYHYQHASVDAQKQNFQAHIRAAIATGLPLIVHSRDADADMADMLENASARDGAFNGVLHCFTGGPDLARRAVAIGFYVSLAGMITFKNAKDLRETVADVPVERLLTETDSPYLAPVPMRGKRNEPSFVRYTHAELAALRGLDNETFARLSTSNFLRLFSRIGRPAGFDEPVETP